jgi:hypothetical protein
MPDAQPHPQTLWAEKENAHNSSGRAENVRHSLRNGFTAYSALSLVSGLFSHHRFADLGVSAARPRSHLGQSLIPASGDQDHTA